MSAADVLQLQTASIYVYSSTSSAQNTTDHFLLVEGMAATCLLLICVCRPKDSVQ
jgi:hypothetical protein